MAAATLSLSLSQTGRPAVYQLWGGLHLHQLPERFAVTSTVFRFSLSFLVCVDSHAHHLN